MSDVFLKLWYLMETSSPARNVQGPGTCMSVKITEFNLVFTEVEMNLGFFYFIVLDAEFEKCYLKILFWLSHSWHMMPVNFPDREEGEKQK